MISLLIEAALRGLIVALTVWIGLRLFRVGNVLAQKAAWGLVLAAAVAMPLLMRWYVLPASFTVRVPVSQPRLPEKSVATEREPLGGAVANESAVAQTEFARTSAPSSGNRFPAPAISKSAFNPSRRNRPADTGIQPMPEKIAGRAPGLPELDLGTVATFSYLGVSAVLLIRMLFGLGMAAKLWLASEAFDVEPGPNPLTHPGRGMRLRFSFGVSSPVTIGSGVLLPAECLGWDREKMSIVLAHERAHVRQGDFYLQLLVGLYSSVFWFSPLGWWLKRKLSDLGEAISDRAGLEEAASSASYAQVLLEFAAMPRPTVLGVAMARSTNLSHRIERLLNESSFRQAFAGSRRRILLAVLLVPVALFAGTALIRVEAAGTAQSVQPPAPAAVPNPAPAPAAAPSVPAPAAEVAPPAPGAPDPAPSADMVPPLPAVSDVAPVPPLPALHLQVHASAVVRADARVKTNVSVNSNANVRSDTATFGGEGTSSGPGYSYSNSSNGDSWALVTDPGQHVSFSGDWNENTRAKIDKARKLANGKFLWFTRSGKSYFVDDSGIVAQIEAMYKPMEELGREQEALGKKQEALGRQQEELGHKQEQAAIPAPDLSKEMAELNEATAKLQAKKGSTVGPEELEEIESKIGAIQSKLGDLQGEIGEKQGVLGSEQGKLGEEQGMLGEEQGRLGERQGKLAEEADRKVKSIIDQSLHNGKAKPVE